MTKKGRPTWFMGLGLPQEDGSYAGDLYRFEGTPYQDIDGAPSNRDGSVIGQMKLDFDDDPHKMQFTTIIKGKTIARDLTRFNFSGDDLVCQRTAASSPDMTNYTDMWWEPATTGWGINVIHLTDTIYGQWYTYESPERAVFLSLDLQRQADGSYMGKVYRQPDGGQIFTGGTAKSAQPDGVEIGSAALVFLDGQRAEFEYVVDGISGQHTLQRFQMGDTANVCEVRPYAADGDGGNDSDGTLCAPEFAIGDSRTLRVSGTSDGDLVDTVVFTEPSSRPPTSTGKPAIAKPCSAKTMPVTAPTRTIMSATATATAPPCRLAPNPSIRTTSRFSPPAKTRRPRWH